MKDEPHCEGHEAGDGGESGNSLQRRERFADAVGDVVRCAKEVAAAHARQADAVERARRAGAALGAVDCATGGPLWSPEAVTQRIVVTELAVALRLSETDARRLVDTAEGLAGVFVATGRALESGAISYRHAEKIVQHSAALPPECLLDYQGRLLELAPRVSVQRLVRHARGAAEEAQPSTAVQRHYAATTERRLSLDPAADGMAFLTHYLPAVEAVAIFNRATELGRSVKQSGDPRTLAQLRVDTLSDLLLNGEPKIPGANRGVRAHVRVTVPMLTMLGTGDSAHLDGYGPIDRLTALELTRQAPGFMRVLTDPVTGIALNYGRTRYKAPADLDTLIRTVHTECTFPVDCSSSATADLDHTRPWNDGGDTAFHNLSPLCSSHHKVKHHTDWNLEQDPGGSGALVWTSPAGFAYVVAPTPIARPAPRFSPASPPKNPTVKNPTVKNPTAHLPESADPSGGEGAAPF
ncbi:HNH endonuclease signature motif containing protein [Subtercola endophyticus]|uniref:HNH endonuclease signature motif containing protein n=1 Tax=Subtercola endophyticus TaxID=2895559 RepID=UPI001E4A16AA|nr:HNH endonuclease signature motif containing protein [Subtercola endophyticus]UFS60022.1 HNH endonuclease [Subtercola endophyticus]